jgi:hypothetical protein
MKRRPFLLLLLAGAVAGLGSLPARGLVPGECLPTATRLCLAGRFQAEVAWTVPSLGSGAGQTVPLTTDTGAFWFFASSNLELTVKVLDGRAVNRHFWVFFGGLSNVAFTLKVTDLRTGVVETYQNPAGRFASVADVAAFNPEAPPAPLLSAVHGRAVAATAAAYAPLPLGGEIPVYLSAGAEPGRREQVPAVAVAPDGSFLVVWENSYDTPGSVHGRSFDAAGHPRGPEVVLSAAGELATDPRVAADPSGRFLAVWSTPQGIAGRRFGADGTPAGAETLLVPGTPLESPDVIADPAAAAGGFLVSWEAPGTQADELAIHLRRFDLQLTPGVQTTLDAPVFLGAPPRLAALTPGGYVVTWGTSNPTIDTPNADLWAQRLDPALQTVGSVLSIAQETPGEGFGVPVAYADGGFAYVWSTGALLGNAFDGLEARRFDAAGTPAGGPVPFHQGVGNNASGLGAIALPSGDTWVVWPEQGLTDPDGGIFAGRFDSSWQLQGEISQINTTSGGFQAQPALAASPGGTVAVWASLSLPVYDPPGPPPPPGALGVFAQRFTAPDCALSSDQLCLGGRFRVTVQFTDPRSGTSGAAQAIPLTGDTGAFWFFDAANLELMVKVLDGRAVNGHFWVFSGALSDVAYTITVTDLFTGQSKAYPNAPHQLASRADIAAF